MAGKHKKSENYLDLIPLCDEKYRWQQDENGNVTVFVENTGLFNRAAQKLLKKPKVSQVHLEEIGSFIWPLIDGKRSVYDIAQLVKTEFGQKAEPLFERLVPYMRSLENCGFIQFKSAQNRVNSRHFRT